MKIRGINRHKKYIKARYGMCVDGASVKRVQADLARKRAE